MPVVSVGPAQRPQNTQLNFRQMIGEVLMWTPDLPVQMAKRFLQNSYRRVTDFRLWYGLLQKGQVNVPQNYTVGQVLVSNGSTTITGTGGMAWTTDFIGRQFRVGFSTPIYTITNVLSSNNLQIDLPWGGQTQTGISYQIFQNIVSFGPNIKRLLAVVNQQQGYRLALNIPQEVLNIYDTWRTSTGWTFMVASYAPSPTGEPQFELYPAPTFLQSFPFLAYIQPPDLVDDNSFPLTFIRSDIVVAGAISDALLFRGKQNKYYDPVTAKQFQARFNEEIGKMARNDDNQYPKDLLYNFSQFPFSQLGADWMQSHDLDSGFL